MSITCTHKQFYIFSRKCCEVDSLDAFKDLFRSVIAKLLPHDMAAFGVCDLMQKRIIHFTNLGYPEAYLKNVMQPSSVYHSPLLQAWQDNRQLKVINLCKDTHSPSAPWKELAKQHAITHIMGYGQVDLGRHQSSYFSFAQSDIHSRTQQAEVLPILIPHLHATLARLIQLNLSESIHMPLPPSASTHIELKKPHVAVSEPAQLSRRENDILHWIALGKTNGEIGSILGISEYTVKNHVQNILSKLFVTNRTQAVSWAIKQGILSQNSAKL